MTEEQIQMVKDCVARSSRLNDWEIGFIDRLASVPEDWAISDRQAAVLARTWDRVTAKD